jgi:hypothetical protein
MKKKMVFVYVVGSSFFSFFFFSSMDDLALNDMDTVTYDTINVDEKVQNDLFNIWTKPKDHIIIIIIIFDMSTQW